MSGGKARRDLGSRVLTGDLSQATVAAILDEVRRWALRGERWAQTMSGPEPSDPEVPPSESEPMDWRNVTSGQYPRPRGCESYESLERSDRNQYCSDVLLPEAIIQLHALRRGLLRGAYVHDSDPEIETAIHAEAQASLASEAPIDRWVDELMMDRQARRLGMGLPMVDSEARDRYDGILPEGSVRSRKRTVKSYKE